jgi:hypothetical protein
LVEQNPPDIYDRGDGMYFLSAQGIPPILLALASGIGVATKCRLIHNLQPNINRALSEERLETINKEGGIIESYFKPPPPNAERESVGFSFIPFVMEQPSEPSKAAAYADLQDLAGNAKARLITKEDVEHLQRLLKVKLKFSGDMRPEQQLHLVFQGITKKFNGFEGRSDLERLLHLLLVSSTTEQDPVDAKSFHCWYDIREVVYLTKLAWVALKLPCLGAIAGNARMHACTHALMGIKVDLNGPPYVEVEGELPERTPVSLTQTTTITEFYGIGKGKVLPDCLTDLFVASVAKQNEVTMAAEYNAQEILSMLVDSKAILPKGAEVWDAAAHQTATHTQVLVVGALLDSLKCRFIERVRVLSTSTQQQKSMQKVLSVGSSTSKNSMNIVVRYSSNSYQIK